MKKKILYIGLIILLFSGCGYKEGVSTETQKSYLFFTGNTADKLVSIDSGSKFAIIKNGKSHQYSVKPGKHLVEIYQGDIMIVNREVFVSDEIAKEIEVK